MFVLVATKVEKVAKLGDCSCYGELHAYLHASPETQPLTGMAPP